MANNVRLNVSKLRFRNLGRLEGEFSRFAEGELADYLQELEAELDAGRQASGKRMKAYSRSYKARLRSGSAVKGSRGSRRKDATPTNLTVSGGLRRSRSVSRIRNGAELGFQGSFPGGSYAQLARWLRGNGFTGWHTITRRKEGELRRRGLEFLQRQLQKSLRVSE